MNCRYCGSSNSASDHRCLRCGRRLHLAAARPAPEVYPVAGTQALAPEPQPDQQPLATSAEPVPESPRRAPYQPALFSTRDLGRVVPIQAYQTRAAERRERAKQAEAAARRHHPPAGSVSLQTDFAFDPDQQHSQQQPALAGAAAAALPPHRRPGSSTPHPPELRYSSAPVAIPMHRTMAAAIDLGMMTVAAGLVCLLISFGIGEWPLPGKPLHWFAGLAAVLSVLYKLVWAAVDTDSPGLRWCHLRLLHFDGRQPQRRERFERIAWSLLSIMAGGLGLIWALVDEESLCWHDHSSKTFLTPYSQVRARINR